MQRIPVKIKVLEHGQGLDLPCYATEGSVGMDLLAAVDQPITIWPNTTTLVPTGLAIAVPDGYEAQIRPRSGLALKHGITLPNSPATIDSDYRGEIKVIVQNFGPEKFVVERGMRFAQMVFAPVVRGVLETVDELPPSNRGENGFGSTGR